MIYSPTPAGASNLRYDLMVGLFKIDQPARNRQDRQLCKFGKDQFGQRGPLQNSHLRFGPQQTSHLWFDTTSAAASFDKISGPYPPLSRSHRS